MKALIRQQTTPTPWGRIVWHRIGSGPPLVLLHGGAGSWTHWQRCSPLLAETYSLLMPDMPGFGASDLPRGDPDPGTISRALLRGLDTLIGSGARFFLTGFSFGGLVAGLMARTAGGRVRVLVLVGPSGLGLPSSRRLPLRSWRGLKNAEARLECHRHNLRVLMLADSAAIDAATVALQAANAEAARLNSRPHSAKPYLRDALPDVAAPIGGIWGEADAVVACDLDARIALLRAADPACRIEIVERAGHWVAHERPATFAAALSRILADGRARTGRT